MKRTIAKFVALVATSIFGMAFLGVAAYIAAATRWNWWGNSLWFPDGLLLVFPAVVGALFGIFSLPFVVAFLKDASLARSLPRIYGVSLIITVVWAALVPGGWLITAALQRC